MVAWQTPSLARWNYSPLLARLEFPLASWAEFTSLNMALRAINSVLRFLADVLNGVPSITWGVVVYGLIVLRFKSFSVLAGGLALALIMIPLILRTTEEVVLLVPNGYREAALALGVSRWQTIVHIVMKTASKGIITGILLALARIGGETAPLLFTAFGNRFWNHSLFQPIAALPLQILHIRNFSL